MPSSTRFWVRACYDFISSEDGDLSFRDGDIMKVEEVSSRNWWIVSMGRDFLCEGWERGFPKPLVASIRMKKEGSASYYNLVYTYLCCLSPPRTPPPPSPQASHVNDNSGSIPSNFVQVLPQYAAPTIMCTSHIKDIKVVDHDSSSNALNVIFSTKEEAEEISHDLVKTKGQISQFVRELR